MVLGMILSLGMVMACDNGEKEEQEIQEVVDNSLVNGIWIKASGNAKIIFNDPNFEYHIKLGSETFNVLDSGTYEATNKGKLTLYQTSSLHNGVPSGTQVETFNATYTINGNKLMYTEYGATGEFTRQE